MPPAGPDIPQLTWRSVLTGMLLGGILSSANIYSGLKIGFTTNMSMASALLGFGVWQTARRTLGTPRFGLHENAMNQTAASAAASIAGAGLVAPIPALTMLTGRELPLGWLMAWVFAVSATGVVVGMGLRRQLILVDKLPFPYGMATAELLREMYARGREAMLRVIALVGALSFAALLKAAVELLRIPIWFVPGALPVGGTAAAAGFTRLSWAKLGFGLEPSLLMLGVGGLVGLRAGISMTLGALVAWAWLAPLAVERGWVAAGDLAADASWFKPLVSWLLWPGVALMVSAALTSFAWSVLTLLVRKRHAGPSHAPHQSVAAARELAPRTFRLWLLGAGTLTVALQLHLFGIAPHAAIAAVLLTFVLAIVAGRVTGETGIAPIGAMGKVTQLSFAAISPGNVTDNLMSANVTGGAASQCSDMLHDLKTGHLVGASPRSQGIAQLAGVAAGAVGGVVAYLLLVPHPTEQLITRQWPAPAVAQWKAVAEVLAAGGRALPPRALEAMVIGAIAGMLLTVADKQLSDRWRRFLPSAASLGLAFVLPAHYALAMLLGGLAVAAARRWAPYVAARFALVIAAGLVAGESLAGVGFAIARLIAE